MGVLLGIGYFLGAVVAGVFGVKLYFKAIAGVCKSKRRIDGQVAIVTGSNTGKWWFDDLY